MNTDTVDSIADDFMRTVRKTQPFENVSITVAYATKLCQRLKAAHKMEVDALKERVKELEVENENNRKYPVDR